VIVLRANHRPRVATPDAEQTRQTLHARRLTEATLARLACQNASAEGLKRLRTLVERERLAVTQERRAAAIRLSGEFHTELAQLTGNTVLCDCLNGLVARSTLISALYESLGRSPCSFEDHEAILAALDAGDAKEAAALMSRHLQSVELKMLERPARGAADLHEVFGALSGGMSGMSGMSGISGASSGAMSGAPRGAAKTSREESPKALSKRKSAPS